MEIISRKFRIFLQNLRENAFFAKQINANLNKAKIFAIFHDIVGDFFQQNSASFSLPFAKLIIRKNFKLRQKVCERRKKISHFLWKPGGKNNRSFTNDLKKPTDLKFTKCSDIQGVPRNVTVVE